MLLSLAEAAKAAPATLAAVSEREKELLSFFYGGGANPVVGVSL